MISKSFERPWPTKRQPASASWRSLMYVAFIVVMWCADTDGSESPGWSHSAGTSAMKRPASVCSLSACGTAGSADSAGAAAAAAAADDDDDHVGARGGT